MAAVKVALNNAVCVHIPLQLSEEASRSLFDVIQGFHSSDADVGLLPPFPLPSSTRSLLLTSSGLSFDMFNIGVTEVSTAKPLNRNV